MQGWFSILLLMVLAAGFAAGSMALSHLVAPRNPTPEKQAPYECGMPPVGDARERQSVKFYLVAMIFLLLDIEVAFLYPWATLFRELGTKGFVAMLAFLAVLGLALFYLIRKGALRWED